MTVRFRSGTEEDLEEVWDLMGLVFGSNFRDYYKITMICDSRFEPDQLQCAVVDGKIVSVLQIFDREVRIGEEIVGMGAIADVATHPDHRGKRYSSTLLGRTIEYMKKKGYGISLLFTGEPRYNFYGRYGWKPFPTWGFEVDVDKVRLEDDQKINRIFNHFFEIPYIKSIYEEYNRGLIGTIVRDTDYWDDHLHWTDKSLGPYVGEEPSLFQLWPEDGYPKAYIRARKGWDNKSVLITECCYLEGYGEATLKFLPKIADFATKNGLKKIAAGLPSQHPIAQWMLSCGGDKVEYKILINFLKRKYKDKVLNGEFIFWATDMF